MYGGKPDATYKVANANEVANGATNIANATKIQEGMS
jgi:hypothetical protein